METRTSEIADGIYRLSTFVPEIAPPAGFTFNQFLVLDACCDAWTWFTGQLERIRSIATRTWAQVKA